MSNLSTYVVVTPARNEAKFIERTIQSVTAQDLLPLRWVIVSDGSNDGTDETVKRYQAQYKWIELLRMPDRAERHFGGKAAAFGAGWERLKQLPFQAIASLDADITFEGDYFSFLLAKLAEDPQLGVVGTPYVDTTSEVYDFRFVSRNHVSGACQLFRRECLEEIGGYVAARGGAIDSIAVITARMKGWKTRTFIEKHSQHHRELGTAERSALQARYVLGCRDYALGNHPLWEVFRVAYQMTKRPYLLRGIALGAGYMRSCIAGAQKPVENEFVQFVRREQMLRLRRFFSFGARTTRQSGRG